MSRKRSISEGEVETSIGEGEKIEGNPSVKKPETALAATEKRQVSAKSGGGEETKKTYFEPVWSDEDEIAVLQGLIDYKTDTGVSPYDDLNRFYQLVKKSVSFDVSKIQVFEKIRTLKKKFDSNLGKGKNGEEPTFAKPHDREVFDLSKSVWGAQGYSVVDAEKKSGGGEVTKKTYFEPVWSDEDEIAVLQSLIDYNTDTGASPYDDLYRFYQFVKKSISFDVSKIQVLKKLMTLKKKFDSNLGKGKNGEEPTFAKPHDREAFDLSKSVWGAQGYLAIASRRRGSARFHS